MKVLAISGSPRGGGNTYGALSYLLQLFVPLGARGEVIELHDKTMEYCNGCGSCLKQRTCRIEDDLQGIYRAAVESDVIMLGAPVYGGSVAAPMKTMMDRFSWWSSADSRAFERKLGIPLVVGRRGGLTAVHAELLTWMYIRGFCIMGSRYWNICFTSNEKGSWDADAEFKRAAGHLVENVIWAYRSIAGSEER